MPKVSVIVPVYNVEKYITKCLTSLINQTLDDIEIIIVNDGSTDNSEQIVKQFKRSHNNIIYVTKENGGLSSARNFGLIYATGEYIAFLDSDDYVDNTEIEGTLQTTPVWHFQLYYPDTKGYTITVEKKEAGAAQYVTVTDDTALSLQGDFLYPASADHLAYANVVNLLDQENAAIKYKPGKIYTADVNIAPYNVTLGFTPSQSYNVIVKVNVADFKTENVKPEFSKN